MYLFSNISRIDGVKKRHGTKEYLEKQKLMHKLKREKKGARREVQRDTAFLARQQLQDTLRRYGGCFNVNECTNDVQLILVHFTRI